MIQSGLYSDFQVYIQTLIQMKCTKYQKVVSEKKNTIEIQNDTKIQQLLYFLEDWIPCLYMLSKLPKIQNNDILKMSPSPPFTTEISLLYFLPFLSSRLCFLDHFLGNFFSNLLDRDSCLPRSRGSPFLRCGQNFSFVIFRVLIVLTV